MILEPFYPKEWVDSTYEIDWEDWKEKGKKGVIFDIDNTLVPHGAPADERALAPVPASSWTGISDAPTVQQ